MNSSTYFVDTSFWISLLESGDVDHKRALAWQQKVVTERIPLVTTEPVLWEFLNFFSPTYARQRGTRLYQMLHGRKEISITGFDDARCANAVNLYSERSDKA